MTGVDQYLTEFRLIGIVSCIRTGWKLDRRIHRSMVFLIMVILYSTMVFLIIVYPTLDHLLNYHYSSLNINTEHP